MALTYQSGEDIQIGDRVTYGGNAGTIELVVETFLRSFPRWGGPLIRRAFEEYATGRFTEEQLLKQVGAWGLTNRRGRPFTSRNWRPAAQPGRGRDHRPLAVPLDRLNLLLAELGEPPLAEQEYKPLQAA